MAEDGIIVAGASCTSGHGLLCDARIKATIRPRPSAYDRYVEKEI